MILNDAFYTKKGGKSSSPPLDSFYDQIGFYGPGLNQNIALISKDRPDHHTGMIRRPQTAWGHVKDAAAGNNA